jgi:hypothetical protein
MAQPSLYQRLIGGLLGEDLSKLDEEQRKRITGQATSRAVQGLLMGEGLLGGLGGYRRERQADVLRQQQRAQQLAQESQMNQVLRTGGQMTQAVLEGRQPLTAAEAMPDESGLALMRGPRDLSRLAGTMEGQQALLANPQLREAVLGMAPKAPAAPEYVYQNVEGVGLVAVNRNDPADTKVIQRIQRPKEEKFQVLTPEETARLGYRPGTVVQRAPNGELKVSQAPSTTDLDPRGFNERQKSGANVMRDAALNYAANLTGLPKQQLAMMTPAEIEAAMKERGGRVTQGGVARTIRGIPFIGEGVLATINPDLAAASTAGGAGLAMIQNPTGPITKPDVDIGMLQFPNPIYPVAVQAQMLRGLLEQTEIRQSDQVEQYDAQGNLIGSSRRGATGSF